MVVKIRKDIKTRTKDMAVGFRAITKGDVKDGRDNRKTKTMLSGRRS